MEALATAQSERMRAEARAEQAGDLDALSTETAKSPVLETLRQKLVELKAQYESKRSVYKPEFPEMLSLTRQITEVEAQIKLEKEAYQRASNAAYKAGRTNEALLKKQIEELRNEVLDLQSRGIQYKILKREADTNRQMYDGLLQRYKEIGVAGDVGSNNIALVDAAVHGQRFKPDFAANMTKGLLGGLFLGMLLALLMEMLDDTLKTPEDIERQIGLGVVGIVPKIPDEDFDEAVTDPKSSFAEAYRSLRTALQYSSDEGAPKVLMVTSAVAGEGKTTSSTMLARQFAQLGQAVLIIDADLRKPSLHKRFNLDNSKGLSDYLASHNGEPQVYHAVDESGFSVITSGDTPANPAELLASDRFRDLLEAARDRYDQIIIDCPPLLGLADAPTIAGFADGVLVVIEAATTRVGVVRATLKRLASARARILGAVLVKFDSRVTGYGYGYGYHYADHYYYYSHYGAYGGAKPSSGRRNGARDLTG
jgi:capsular exopolysaccharide synthesis family protein